MSGHSNIGWHILWIYLTSMALVWVAYLSVALWHLMALRRRCYPNQRVDERLLAQMWGESRWERERHFDSDLLVPGTLFAPLFLIFMALWWACVWLYAGVRKLGLFLLAQVLNGGRA